MRKPLASWNQVAFGIATLIASFSFVRNADACTPQPPGWWAMVINRQVPSDGWLLLEYRCLQECGSLETPSLSARDAAGRQIAGEVRAVTEIGAGQHIFGWRASRALSEGEYGIELPSFPGPRSHSFEVVAKADPAPMLPTITSRVEIVATGTGERVCCATTLPGQCGPSCYDSRLRRSVYVTLDWSHEELAAHWSQYLHRVTWDGADAAESSWSLGPFAQAAFDGAQDEYCYTLELESLVDGAQQMLTGCVPHSGSSELGFADPAPAAVHEVLASCEQPPEGLTEEWCEARRSRCGDLSAEACRALDAICADSGAAGAPSGPEPSAPSSRGGGCAMGAAAPSSAAMPALALLISLTSLRRRNRR